MPTDDGSNFPHDFIERMDAGEFDGRFSEEIGNLSNEELEKLALILTERDEKSRRRRW